VSVKITPAKRAGFMNATPEYINYLYMAGIIHAKLHVVGRLRNPFSVNYAFFQAMRGNLTAKEYAEFTGKKVYDIWYGLPHRGKDTGLQEMV